MTNLEKEIYKTGYTIEKFASLVGLDKSTLYNTIHKRYKRTRGTTIFAIAKGLKKPYEEVERLLNER